jgi:hypothetical protein
MDLYLNYNKKVESIDTQFEVTSGILTKTLEILVTVFIQF